MAPTSTAAGPPSAPLDVGAFRRLVDDGAVIVDVRQVEPFAAGHIPGSLSIPLRPQFASWLGWLVGRDRTIVFVLDEGQDRGELVRQCLAIGYERLAGELVGGIESWRSAGLPVATVPRRHRRGCGWHSGRRSPAQRVRRRTRPWRHQRRAGRHRRAGLRAASRPGSPSCAATASGP